MLDAPSLEPDPIARLVEMGYLAIQDRDDLVFDGYLYRPVEQRVTLDYLSHTDTEYAYIVECSIEFGLTVAIMTGALCIKNALLEIDHFRDQNQDD